MTTVADILKVMESWAPGPTAQSYDNTGLLVGNRTTEVSGIMVALDLVPHVIGEAISKECQLIVTHHPPLFSPIKSIVSDNLTGSLMQQLISQGISLIASHTNLDAARGGVSFELARVLGLTDIRFLDPLPGTLVKLVTFVPHDSVDRVRDALASEGAGVIGNYDSCGFAVEGTGYFRPLDGANPTIGAVGQLEESSEIRIEVEVESWKLSRVIDALTSAHPYEEVAYDIYKIDQRSTRYGMGAIGTLDNPVPLSSFLNRVGTTLNTESVRFTGQPDSTVKTVAVCGGSGSSLIGTAMAQRADAYVTGDVTYHKFFDALNPDGTSAMAIIDPGHYETEFLTEGLIKRYLHSHLPDVNIHTTGNPTSPIRVHITDPG